VERDRALEYLELGDPDKALKHVGKDDTGIDTMLVRAQIYKFKADYKKAITLLNQIIESKETGDDSLINLVAAYLLKSEICLTTGDFVESNKWLDNADETLGKLKENVTPEYNLWNARMLNLKGLVSEKKLKLDEAQNYFKSALKIFESVKSKQDIANTLHNLGFLHERKGKFDNAISFYNRSHEIRKKLANKYDIATSLKQIGTVYGKKGNLDRALIIFNESLKIREEVGNQYEIAKLLINIGIIYKLKGKFNEALEVLNKALRISKEVNDQENTSIAISNIGNILLDTGQLDKALNTYKMALPTFEASGDSQKIASLQKNIGLIYQRKGELNLALEYYQNSLKSRELIGNKEDIARSLHSIAIIYLYKGELDGSLDHLDRTHGILKQIGNHLEISSVLKDKGIIFQRKGKFSEAENHFKKSLQIRKKIGNELEISETLYHLILLHIEIQSNKYDKYYNNLKKISASSQNRVIKIRSRLAEAAILQTSSRMTKKVEAHELFEKVIEEDLVDYELTVFAMLNLCEFLLLELKSSGEKEVLVEIQTILEKLYEMATDQESHLLLVEILIIQSKLALLDYDMAEAESFLGNARDIAEEKGLDQFLLKITYLQHQLDEESNRLSELAKQLPLDERIEQLDIENYIKEAAQVRDYGKEATDMVVHDIKNLIQVNLNFAHLLLLDENLPEDMRRYVHFIELSTKEMQLLISSLLTTEKLENDTFNLLLEKVDAWDLILKRIDLFNFRLEENKVHVTLDKEINEVYINCDKYLIRRVFDNLIHNAGKFSTPEGNFTIRAKDNDSHWIFEFENDCEPIPGEFHDKIFDKYSQYNIDDAKKKQGVGLGLSFCKVATEAMGGSIDLNSPIPGREDGVKITVKLEKYL
jgi:signal transduction histidine kinase/predicted negative regulator of RcsB-dependent stress response